MALRDVRDPRDETIHEQLEQIDKLTVALTAIVAAWEAEDDTALDLALVAARNLLEAQHPELRRSDA